MWQWASPAPAATTQLWFRLSQTAVKSYFWSERDKRGAINHDKRDVDQRKPLYFLILFRLINQQWNVCSTQSDVNALHPSYSTLCTKREWILSLIVSLKQAIQIKPYYKDELWEIWFGNFKVWIIERKVWWLMSAVTLITRTAPRQTEFLCRARFSAVTPHISPDSAVTI